MASAQCAVIKGDSPIEISFMFRNEPIDAVRMSAVITDSGKRAKTLTIDNVDARHVGEYTCVASNLAGSTTRTAVLSVNGIRKFLSLTVTRVTVSNMKIPTEILNKFIFPLIGDVFFF